jgi:hypothetical protein
MNYSISILSFFNPLFIALFALVLILLGKAIYTLKSFPELRGKAIKELVFGSLVTILLLAIFIVLPLIGGITIKSDMLSLRLPSGFTFTDYTSDDIISAEVVDLNSQPEYAIQSKQVGTETRDYREGIFILENGDEAEVLLNGNQALFVKTKDRPLLLGPGNFENFISNFDENIFPVTP